MRALKAIHGLMDLCQGETEFAEIYRLAKMYGYPDGRKYESSTLKEICEDVQDRLLEEQCQNDNEMRNANIEKIQQFDRCFDPAFNPEYVGQALNCDYTDNCLYLDDFDFVNVSDEMLIAICEYIDAAIIADIAVSKLRQLQKEEQ